MKQALRRAASEAERTELLNKMKTLAATTPPEQRQLVNELVQLVQANVRLDKSVPKLAEILRSLARGNFEDERAVAAAYLTLPTLARSARLDLAPYRTEARAVARDLVTRYPGEGRAHALLASVLLEANAARPEVLTELRRCVQLDGGAWCDGQRAALIADYQKPRCTGAQLSAPLRTFAASEWNPSRPKGRNIEANNEKLVLDPTPMLQGNDYSEISVDGDGNLALEIEPVAARRLAETTARLSGSGRVVLMLGDQVLLAATVVEPITNGRIRVTHGRNPPFAIEALCRTITRPQVPDGY